MLKIPKNFLTTTESIINRFQLLPKNAPVVVAFSGGKDSLMTSLILKQLGYQPLLIHINMGFLDIEERRKYLLSMVKNHGLVLEILNIKHADMQSMLPEDIRNNIQQRLNILFSCKYQGADSYTPCTHCYNVKFLLLQYIASLYKIEHIAFGHHGTDAVVSLLKSVLMYIDRWDYQHEFFLREQFQAIVEQFQQQYNTKDFSLSRIEQLMKNQYASTDEPPLKKAVFAGLNLKLIRPLFGLFEHDIKEFYAKQDIAFQTDGCEFMVKPSFTPREMIHKKLFDQRLPEAMEMVAIYHQLIIDNLSSDGSIPFDTRNNRSQLLGKSYKMSELSEIKL